jgi:hypothetical protein
VVNVSEGERPGPERFIVGLLVSVPLSVALWSVLIFAAVRGGVL